MDGNGGKARGMRIGLKWRFAGAITLLTVVLMAGVVTLVRNETSSTLERQIVQRGSALAQNLAHSCVEPMQLAAAEKTLDLSILAQSYIQSGGSEADRKCLLDRPPMLSLILECLKNLGRESVSPGLQNEGIVSAIIVNPAGKIEAFADVFTPRLDWFDRIGTEYAAPLGSGMAAGESSQRVWKSPALGGILVIGVPISSRLENAAGESVAPLSVSSLGTVYLSLSLGLVDRAVARAIGILLAVTAIVIVIGAIASIFMAGFLTQPIRRLQAGVLAIAGGDFRQRIVGRTGSDEIGSLTEAFNDMAKGLAEREIMRGAFNSYVSRDLLQEIIKNPDLMKPGGTRKTATVLFSFFSVHNEIPSLAERMDPEALVRFINDYLEVEVKLIARHNGFLDKFIGDAVIAIWGVPLPMKNHAEAAIRCALDIRKAVAELNGKRAAKGLPTTDLSIGINTGSLVVGSMGSEGRKLDYTVIGEDVNFAARLAGAGAALHPGSIWAGKATVEEVRAIADCRSLGEMEFKGLGKRRVAEVSGIEEKAKVEGA